MMRIIRDYWRCPQAYRGAVVALGNFDGVHLGHRAILTACVERARALQVKATVMTFSPHPREFFGSDIKPLRLQTLRQKLALFETAGIEAVFLVRFNAAFAALSPQDFVAHALARDLAARHIVTGYNFAFGKGRGGDTAFLAHAAKEAGMGFSSCAPISAQGLAVSSSAIREQLAQGDVRGAAVLLGRYYSIEGRVRHGDKRGRTLGFPTANIALGPLFRPRFGVYVVWVWVDGKRYGGVANIGLRPMYALQEPLLEVHVFDMKKDIYGQNIRVELVDYVREERYFDCEALLIERMVHDSQQAQQILKDAV